MSRLAQRYWASLTDAVPEVPDHLADQGRCKDGPLWRRYLASLLDFELGEGVRPAEVVEPGAAAGPARARGGTPDTNPPSSTVYYTLDRTVDVVSAEPVRAGVGVRGSRRALVGMGLAAVVVLGTGFGVSVVVSGHRTVVTPIVIEASPSPTVNKDAVVEAGGYAWVPPKGWRRDVSTGAEVHYTSPDGKQEVLAKSALARGDLMETWKVSEANARQGENYKRIRLEAATFRDHPSIVWEYTFTLNGEPWHALLLGFEVGGTWYQISTWYQPDIERQALRTYMDVRASFIAITPTPTESEMTTEAPPPATSTAPGT